LHVGAQRIDARADAVLLEIGGLIEKCFGQFNPRLGGADVGGRPQAAIPPIARSVRGPWNSQNGPECCGNLEFCIPRKASRLSRCTVSETSKLAFGKSVDRATIWFS
jgi:hypothetical protein